MIKPTVGRVVWVRNRVPSDYGRRPGQIDKAQPEVGFIVYVHSDTCVNVAGFDRNGEHFAITSLVLRQLEDDHVSDEHWTITHAEWMPYQMGQAARTEQAERAAAQQKEG